MKKIIPLLILITTVSMLSYASFFLGDVPNEKDWRTNVYDSEGYNFKYETTDNDGDGNPDFDITAYLIVENIDAFTKILNGYSTISDEPNASLMFAFDADSDGTLEANYSYSGIFTNTYSDFGTNTATLFVKDSWGNTDSATAEIIILNNTPTAAFTIAHLNRTNKVFGAHASEDADKDSITYAWDVDGNGTLDTAFSNAYMVYTNTYTSLGTNKVILHVKDKWGAIGKATNECVRGLNTPPYVELISPSNNTIYSNISAITLLATATASDSSVSSVEFLVDGTKVASDTTSPYSNSWTPLFGSTYILTAKATSDNGLSATSFPIKITIEESNSSSEVFYVSQTGSDDNSGTNSTEALKSIQEAVDKASEITNTTKVVIKVEKGVYTADDENLTTSYTNNVGLSITRGNLQLMGGYSSDFKSRTGYSTIKDDSYNSLYTMVGVWNVSDFVIDGFIIQGGDNYNDDMEEEGGGGIRLVNVDNCVINNCIIQSNETENAGGGIYLVGNSNYISAIVRYNEVDYPYSKGFGAGVYVSGNYNKIGGQIIDNDYYSSSYTVYGGGICIASNSYNNEISADILHNEAKYGGGVALYYAYNTIVSSTIIHNISDYDGGGVYVIGGVNNTITGFIGTNETAYDGGGIYAQFTSTLNITSIISSNDTSSGDGGGIYLNNTEGATINSILSDNYAYSEGGGVMLYYSKSTTLSGNILDNYAPYGGGVASYKASNETISASITSNTATDGGGAYIKYSSNISISGPIAHNATYNNLGGGIFVTASYNIDISSDIYGNMSEDYGGGVYFSGATNCTISGKIYENLAMTDGGSAIYMASSHGCLFNGTMYRNTFTNTTSAAGPIFAIYRGKSNTVSGRIYNNTTSTTQYGGGGLTLDDANTVTVASEIFDNTSPQICLDGGSYLAGLVITNSYIGTFSGTGEVAIKEISADLSGHTVAQNKFITNTLAYLYRDYSGGDVDLSEINLLNTSTHASHDALIATLNTFTSAYPSNYNPAPTVILTGPLDKAIFLTNDVITIKADASDINGSVSYVNFYINNTLTNKDTTSPYEYSVSNLALGSYKISAVAYDDKGEYSSEVSKQIYITNISVYYVSTNGSDLATGTSPSTPLRGINTAIAKASLSSGIQKIYVSEGMYKGGTGIANLSNTLEIKNMSYLSILGGYDTAFTNQNSLSVLDAEEAHRIMLIKDSTNIEINGFVFTRGKGDDNSGGGILGESSMRLTITNCYFSNNYSPYYGGGLYISASESTYHITCVSNVAGNGGGGAYIYGNSNTIIATFSHNRTTNITSADSDGGGLYLGTGISNRVEGLFYSNMVDNDGGALYLNYADKSYINAITLSNHATRGAGVFLNYADNNTLILTNTLNDAKTYGGGVYLYYADSNNISGYIANNHVGTSSTGWGGGIYNYYSDSNTISASMYNNASYSGSAIYNNVSSYTTISASIISNTSVYYGALYLASGISNRVVNSVIAANTVTNNYGALTVYSGTMPTISAVITNNNAQSAIELMSSNSIIISNCVLGGGIGTTYAINESSLSSDTTNHTLYGNTFITNNLTYLYKDAGGSIVSNTNISVLNTPSSGFHDATTAGGNTITNN